MIYAGFYNFGGHAPQEEILVNTLGSFTQDLPAVLHKDSLVLCYGKLSTIHDIDTVWENTSSILMGRVFDKNFSYLLQGKEFRNFSYLNTKEALGKIWGKYVYLNVHKKELEVVVDSTGQLPFFYHPFSDGSILFSSDVEIIFRILHKKPEYNWVYLSSYLAYGNSSAIQTPFKNIFELPPGCSLKIRKNERKTIPFWNPLSSYNEQALKEKDAVSVLQSTLKPWIEPYKNVCVSLSGGLDSSALVYCLKDIMTKSQSLTALNYFHSQVQSSNELIHARQVCKETGIKLIEVDVSNSLPFDPPQHRKLLKPNKPFPSMISLRWLEVILDSVVSDSSFLFMSGHGSDHVFMRPPSKKFISDYILEKGFRGAKKEIENIAQFFRNPLFPTLTTNVKSLLAYFFYLKNNKRNLKTKTNNIPSWAKPELIKNIERSFIHPIYAHLPKKILPGKYDQIDAIYEGLASIHVEDMSELSLTSYPFLYQPVVEFALSFPTYELFAQGYDRYPLRKSISDTFQTDTVWRRDKSQTTGIFQLGVKKNIERVLELCLEGVFATQGFVEKKALKETITLIASGDVKFFWFLMHLASAEIFLRYWDEKPL